MPRRKILDIPYKIVRDNKLVLILITPLMRKVIVACTRNWEIEKGRKPRNWSSTWWKGELGLNAPLNKYTKLPLTLPSVLASSPLLNFQIHDTPPSSLYIFESLRNCAWQPREFSRSAWKGWKKIRLWCRNIIFRTIIPWVSETLFLFLESARDSNRSGKNLLGKKKKKNSRVSSQWGWTANIVFIPDTMLPRNRLVEPIQPRLFPARYFIPTQKGSPSSLNLIPTIPHLVFSLEKQIPLEGFYVWKAGITRSSGRCFVLEICQGHFALLIFLVPRGQVLLIEAVSWVDASVETQTFDVYARERRGVCARR